MGVYVLDWIRAVEEYYYKTRKSDFGNLSQWNNRVSKEPIADKDAFIKAFRSDFEEKCVAGRFKLEQLSVFQIKIFKYTNRDSHLFAAYDMEHSVFICGKLDPDGRIIHFDMLDMWGFLDETYAVPQKTEPEDINPFKMYSYEELSKLRSSMAKERKEG
jgi:hypothetical protein